MSNVPSPSSDPVTAALNAIAAIVTGVATPLIAEHLAQRYDNQFKSRCEQLQETLAVKDETRRADLLNRVVLELCSDAGTPAGGLSDKSIEIPVSHFVALYTIAAGKIRADQNLAALSAALRKAQ